MEQAHTQRTAQCDHQRACAGQQKQNGTDQPGDEITGEEPQTDVCQRRSAKPKRCDCQQEGQQQKEDLQFLKEKQEYVLSKQLLRSGTSVGANLAEAECAISKKDFLAKVYIALKECSEAQYWLELLYETEYLTEEEFRSIAADCEELRKMLSATTKTINSTLHSSLSTL